MHILMHHTHSMNGAIRMLKYFYRKNRKWDNIVHSILINIFPIPGYILIIKTVDVSGHIWKS